MLSQVFEETKAAYSGIQTSFANFFVTETTGEGNTGGSGVMNSIKMQGGGNTDFFATKLLSFVPMIQTIGSVLIVIFMCLLAIKMAMSAVTSDSRGQAESMKSFGIIIFSLMVLINAVPIVGSFM